MTWSWKIIGSQPNSLRFFWSIFIISVSPTEMSTITGFCIYLKLCFYSLYEPYRVDYFLSRKTGRNSPKSPYIVLKAPNLSVILDFLLAYLCPSSKHLTHSFHWVFASIFIIQFLLPNIKHIHRHHSTIFANKFLCKALPLQVLVLDK